MISIKQSSHKLLCKSWAFLENGKIRPIIDRTFQFSAVKQAHEYMEANKNIGKIILKITE
ncbi:zinc-binding dehydrogenase [Enterococcus faecium]